MHPGKKENRPGKYLPPTAPRAELTNNSGGRRHIPSVRGEIVFQMHGSVSGADRTHFLPGAAGNLFHRELATNN
jgi:hypothetical protein